MPSAAPPNPTARVFSLMARLVLLASAVGGLATATLFFMNYKTREVASEFLTALGLFLGAALLSMLVNWLLAGPRPDPWVEDFPDAAAETLGPGRAPRRVGLVETVGALVLLGVSGTLVFLGAVWLLAYLKTT